LGPLLAAGVLLLFPGDYRKVFIVAAIPAAFGVVSILAFVKERKRTEAHKLGKLRLRDFSGRYYAFLGIVFLFTLGNSTDALLLVKAGDLGVRAEWIPMLYMVFNSVSVLFSVPARDKRKIVSSEAAFNLSKACLSSSVRSDTFFSNSSW
ncbi:MFS transporter, partial [Dehalococcoides mccartyi]